MTLLQATAPAGGGMINIIMIVLMFAVFYWFMIRPQQQKAKELEKYKESIKVGDHVVTIGGIHGKVISVNDTTLVIAVENGKLKIEKAALSIDASTMLNANNA